MSNKNESKNLYIHLYIAEILSLRSEESALTISQIQGKLKDNYDVDVTWRTVSRNINGMSDDFLLCDNGKKKGVGYWIEGQG